MHLLGNGLLGTYSKRDVDSRLRVLYEKEVSLQTTEPPSFLVIGIHPIDGHEGSGYTEGQEVSLLGDFGELQARVVKTKNGGIEELDWDRDHVYDTNPETINRGTVEADENDVFDKITDPTATPSSKPLYYEVKPTPVNGTPCRVRVVTHYAPGAYPRYGTLGHPTVHDPLVQASYLTGYVDKALERTVVMTFRGYVSKYDPRWPWSATQAGNPNAPVDPNRPNGSPRGITPDTGDLWYESSVKPAEPSSSGTGAIAPESLLSQLPDPPWRVRRWDGFAWVPGVLSDSRTYEPDRLDSWEFLNVTDDTNEGAGGQNTGFYWLTSGNCTRSAWTRRSSYTSSVPRR